jgi:hypothetical protein
MPLNAPVTQELVLACTSGSVKWTLRPPVQQQTYSVTITPTSGVLKKRQTCTVCVTLQCWTTVSLAQVITFDVEDGPHYFLPVRGTSVKSAFGCVVKESELESDAYGRAPPALIALARRLHESQGYLRTHIFRQQADEEQRLKAMDAVNRGASLAFCSDPNVPAVLIKQWFRDLPSGLLDEISPDALSKLGPDSSEKQLLDVLSALTEPRRTLFLWLVSLLANVSVYEGSNQMGAKNLAVVISPNLYRVEDRNLTDSVMILNKLMLLLQQFIALRRTRQIF